MKLIDKDKLLKVVKKHHDFYSGAMVASDKARRDELHQVICDIREAAEEDAVPVTWLCGKMHEEGERGDTMKAEYLKELIWEWHQEDDEDEMEVEDEGR